MKLLGYGDRLLDSVFSKFIKEEGVYYVLLENGESYSLSFIETIF